MMPRKRKKSVEGVGVKDRPGDQPLIRPGGENQATGMYPEVKVNRQDEYQKEHAPVTKATDRAVFYGAGGSMHPIIDGKRVSIVWEKVRIAPDIVVWKYITKNPGIIRYMREQGFKETL